VRREAVREEEVTEPLPARAALAATAVLLVATAGVGASGSASAGRVFHTAGGAAFCKLDDTLRENPFVECWRPSDGRLVSIEHAAQQRGRTGSYADFKGKRPSGYPLLAIGATRVWRCRNVNSLFVRLARQPEARWSSSVGAAETASGARTATATDSSSAGVAATRSSEA
jgi:hypothetical protein